ncbi:MAG: hypothetical protein ACLGHP_03005, partial [Vicinamibacteria bacterium]
MIRLALLGVAALFLIAGDAPSAQSPASPVSPGTSASTAATDGRHPEEGRPFIRTYAPLDVNAAGQNWAIVQDARGVIYVGSQSGVIEFDGVNWRLIENPELDTVRSLAIGADGVIYAGLALDFGYLAPDAAGALEYVSLRDKLPESAPRHTDVWRVFATDQGVLFQTEQAIFRWANDTITVIPAPSRFNRASLVDGRLYLTLPESGLNVLEGDSLRALPGTSALALEVYPVILRYDDTRLLIGTRFDGLYLYDGTSLTRFQTALDAYFKSASIYRGIELPDGTILLASTNAGVALMDRQGRALMTLGRGEGLASDAVYHMMADREGAIWTAGERGIGRIEFPSPATAFTEADGFTGAWVTTRFEGRLYAAWQGGVKYLEPADGARRARLLPVSGIGQQTWAFVEVTDESGIRPPVLVAASTDGLYQLRGTAATPIYAPRDGTFRAAVVDRSRVDRTRVWVGLFDGLASFRWVNGQWIDEGRVPGVTEQVRSLAEEDDGTLWAGTNSVGLLRLTFAERPDDSRPRPVATVTRYGEEDGLAVGGVNAQRVGDTIYFNPWGSSPANTVATWDPVGQRFVKDELISNLPHDRLRGSFGLADGGGGKLLVNAGRGTRVLTPDGRGGWTVDETLFSRFGPMPTGYAFMEPDGVVWIPWQQQFVRFDTTAAAAAPAPFQVLIRRVTAGADRVLFGGVAVADAPAASQIGSGSLPVDRLASWALTVHPSTRKTGVL